MRCFARSVTFGLVAAGLILVAGCWEEPDHVVAPTPSQDSGLDERATALAWGLIDAAGWEVDDDGGGLAVGPQEQRQHPHLPVMGFERTIIAGDIAHYSATLQVGPGEYDIIGIHRVVKERRPNRPIHTHKSIFMQHGSSKDFVGMWLPGLTSETTPDDFGMGVYLAEHDVDVWGIDQSWTLVPGNETETEFMIDWGLDRQMGDLRTAVAIARRTRTLTGSGAVKMMLAGYSNGIPTTVSLVNEETQLPPGRRDVGGYVPIDCPIKAAPGLLQETLAFYSDLYGDLYAGGLYAEPVTFAPMAELVRCCPDDISPFDPTMTNLEYALTMSVAPVLFPGHPFHYWAGTFDEFGAPTGLRFTDWELWLDFLASGTAYEPIIWSVEWTGYVAGTLETPYDDHLGEIQVPILNITPAGGFGVDTHYGLSLLGSSDVQTLMPSKDELPTEDYAHIDIFTDPDSETLVWQPLLEWIEAHTPGH